MTGRLWLFDRRVFVDTSALFAVAVDTDESHSSISALLLELVATRALLVTTNFVLAELHALLLTRLNRRVAARALAAVDASPTTTVVRVSARDERRAREILFRYTDEDFSLTDCISFAVMERLRIRKSLTLDSDFAQYGWIVLPAADD